jgi:hypothetical protein
MPNTLAHFGVNVLATRGLIRGSELPWIYLGCIVPDLPWILQRVVTFALPRVDPYDLRLYAANQASLFLCLVLSAALAAISATGWRTFGVLGLGSLLHLLLDACQIKWGNGVGLLVPLDWRLTRFDLFWPEHAITYLLTLAGLGCFIVTWPRAARCVLKFSRERWRWGVAVLLGVAYFVLPLLWMPSALAADHHFVATLRSEDRRTGSRLELDRARFQFDPEDPVLLTFAGEDLRVIGLPVHHDGVVSVRGQFAAPDTLEVQDHHLHRAGLRDLGSFAGLGLVTGLWALVLLRSHKSTEGSRFSTF